MVSAQAKANKGDSFVRLVSQNVRGLKSDIRLDELFAYIVRLGVLATCVQETWRTGTEVLQNNGCMIMLAGQDSRLQVGNRGAQGVGIALNPCGVEAWKAGGCVLHNDFGPRMIAIRLLLRDSHKNNVGVFLVSAYAPVSSESDAVWDRYYDQLDTCISRRLANDILIIGTDSNASIGVKSSVNGTEGANSGYSGPVGLHGLPHVNDSGRRLQNYLSTNTLFAATTSFKKRNYGTWQHPRSGKLHQIDHFVVSATSRKAVLDAGITEQILDSDHRAIRCKLRIMARLKRRTDLRTKLIKLDYSSLNSDNATAFCDGVLNNIAETDDRSYASVASAMAKTATSMLPKKERAQPGWFKGNETVLLPLIKARNSAMADVFKRRTRSSTLKLRLARKSLGRALTAAKNAWITGQCNALNASNGRGTKSAWDIVSKLRAGLSKTRPSAVHQMKKPDGSNCKTPAENAEVFREHFESLYGRVPEFDPSVIDSLHQHAVAQACDHQPSDDEIRSATRRLHDKGPGDSGLSAQAWKCLLKVDQTFQLLKDIILEFWHTEKPPVEWETGLLKILPKSGDLSNPGNYRGIMLLEIAYKIIAIILQDRLRPIAEGIDHESQCGFRPGRGCVDAVFTVKMALKKRREHGLETWVLFLDLVKAFDRVPRELLWQILSRFGVPDKLVSLLVALHEHVYVKFTVDDVTHTISCVIGVKQGDILGPILFTFFVAAIMITWRATYDGSMCIFRSKPDFILTGRRAQAYGTEFALCDSEYADDTAVLFDSRYSLEYGVPRLVIHFGRFGMEVHTGQVIQQKRSKSKSEILFCSKPLHLYNDPDSYDNANLTDIVLANGNFIPIVAEFLYLGSMLARDCSDLRDVEHRIEKANNAFGALRRCLFSSLQVTYAVKRLVYCCMILSILLYGSECWCLTEKLFRQLRNFHARCVRAMCRVNRRHTREHHISTADLLDRLGLATIDTFITRNQLRWAGHLRRMDFSRLPRRMMSCWVRAKRPRGAPRFTYGRALYKALQKAEIERRSWTELAADRAKWRELISKI